MAEFQHVEPNEIVEFEFARDETPRRRLVRLSAIRDIQSAVNS